MKQQNNNNLDKNGCIGQILKGVSRNMTIKQKLVFMIMIACIATLIVAVSIFMGYEWANLREFMVINLSTQAEILADNLTSPVMFNYEDDARETLSSLRVESSIVFGGVYTKEGNLMASYYKMDTDSSVQPQNILEDGHEFSGEYITVFRKIILDGEVLGTVCIRSGLDRIWIMLWSRLKITFAVIIVSLIAAYIISSKLQGVVSKPVVNLAKLAKSISDEKDYSVRGKKVSNDEIGMLINAFNEMLNQIQQRDKALVDANKQLEAKVAERTSDLEETIEKLNESNKQLQEFTYIASHDLREPLRKVSSFGQLLAESLEGKLDKDDMENLGYMIDGASRMQVMIEALLTYSRVTTKGVDFEPVDLNQVIEELMAFELSIKIEETNAKVNIEKPLLAVDADPTQLRQLLQNLIANGLKYQAKDVTPEITICSKITDENMIRIEVQDNGIGIKEDKFEDVFVMFKRLHNRQQYEGTGIGLAVCKKIVKRHGGDIGVSSTYGEGSTFWFTMPRADKAKTEIVTADISKNEKNV